MPLLRLLLAVTLAIAGGVAEAARTTAATPGLNSLRIIDAATVGTCAVQRCSVGPMKAESIFRRRALSLVKRAAATDDERRRGQLLARAADWQRRALAMRAVEPAA